LRPSGTCNRKWDLHSQAGGRRSRSWRPGGGTSNPDYAQIDPKTQKPVQNPARYIWVTETALATALNVSYMASQLALFSVVVGVALLLTGVGLIVLALGAFPGRAPTESARRRALARSASSAT
jgi:hypothetical protein